MRKYYQLLLVLVSVISVATLLFYRHEYLKLRYVLQVLDFFGNFGYKNDECVSLMKNVTIGIDDEYLFSEPRSAWTSFGNNYLFSTFWLENDQEMYSRTIAVGPRSAFVDFKCRLWFEKGDTLVAKYGKFTYSLDIDSTAVTENSILKYTLRCRIKNKQPLEIPYGVVFIDKAKKRFLPIHYKKIESVLESVVCVQPDYSGLAKTNLIEFLSYYNVIGISHVIIYDAGIQHSIFPFLESVGTNKNIFKSVSVLNWNFPPSSAKMEYLAFKDDCLSRSYGKVKFVILSNWNEYFVPNIHKSINELLLPHVHDSEVEISLPTLICCNDVKDDTAVDNSSPLAVRKSYCHRGKEIKMVAVVIPALLIENTSKSKVLAESSILRVYKDCDGDGDNVIKHTPLHLSSIKDFTSHKLLQLWKIKLQTNKISDLDNININSISDT